MKTKRLKRICFIFLLSALFLSINTSCSSDDDTDNTQQKTKKHYLKAKIDNESTDISVLQTGNTVYIKFWTNIPDSLLKIEPITDNAIFHQKKGVDYDISFLDKKEVDILEKNQITPSQSIASLTIKEPGTFRLEFKAWTKDEGYVYSDTVIFSAVEINTWSETSIYLPSLSFFELNTKKCDLSLLFTIDNGNQEHDNYLVNEKFETYKVINTENGYTYAGQLNINNTMNLFEKVVDAPAIALSMVPIYYPNMKMNIILNNGKTEIEYKNIPIKSHYPR